ncbi:secretory calcium-binding phosphoprotein 1 [Sinocyclocheilus anshuiensis]|uniref:secretory calcium-binding phosphoprotein 1 n=1 Tax=Sinocyclocheilus anshuiensis TaxID=1608454 RepID=UPI0007B857F2|nr:PREDICTED: dentin sialophosphoprotein-like [Sinocyclocheilus anshuiensis]
MNPAILILCLLGAAYANPILHKMAMEVIQHASNSSESSSISESSDQSNISEPSDEKSKETVSDSNSSESTESDSNEPISSESHSVESLIGKSETALTSDNTQSSKENVRRGWIYTLKWVHKNNNAIVQATSQPEENDIKSTSDESKKSESSESSESQEMVVLSTKEEDKSVDTSESTENSYIVDGTEYSTSNSSSSSSSSESTESKDSAVDSESRSIECQPGADSQECDSEEDFPQDIGDDGATDPFNGILMPDVTEP